jgi:hypothetical protein
VSCGGLADDAAEFVLDEGEALPVGEGTVGSILWCRGKIYKAFDPVNAFT